MKLVEVLAFCVVVSFVTAQPGSAEPVLFSSLAEGDTYNTNFTFTIGGPADIRQAQMFTPTTEGRLTSLELALALFSGTDRVVAEILTNVSNHAESFAHKRHLVLAACRPGRRLNRCRAESVESARFGASLGGVRQ